MAHYDYSIVSWNGSLTGGNLACRFRQRRGPMNTRVMRPIFADVPDFGASDVRAQPKPSIWEMWVTLTNVAQTDIDSFYDQFDESAGELPLTANDGDGKAWYVNARLVGTRRRSENLFIALFHVADPVWLEGTASTGTKANQSGDSFAWTQTNGGNRQAKPTFTITPNAVKTTGTDIYRLSLRGFVVNRSNRYWHDLPVHLFDDGGADDTIDHATMVAAGDSLANGDDVRVWINHLEVPRWLNGTNTATMRCWANLTMPPSARLTLSANMTAGSPADGGEITFVEGVRELADRGQIVIEDELITYQARDIEAKKITGIERGAWGSTAAAHTALTVTAYRCDTLFVISSDKSNADAAVAPADRRPAIDLKNSTNTKWYWGNQTDDGSTVFYDPLNPNRTAMWLPISDVPESDENHADALPLTVGKAQVAYTDQVSKVGIENVHRLRRDFPQQIPGTASAITYTAQKRNEIRLRMLAEDIYGSEVELIDLQDVSAGFDPAATITPDEDIAALILQGVRSATCGNDEETVDITLSTLNHGRFQKVVLDYETEVESIQLRLKKSGGAPSFTYVVRIYDNSGSRPEDGAIVAAYDTSSVGNFTAAGLQAVYQTIEFTASTGNIILQPGTYWIAVALSVYSSGNFILSAGLSSTKHNAIWDAVTGTYGAGNFLWFRLMHPHGGPIQPEVKTLAQNTTASFDLFEIAVGATDNDGIVLYPYVGRSGDFTAGLYHCVGTIKNTTTGDSIAIDCWMATGASLEIDCENRTVKYTEGNHVISLPGVITPSNLEKWIDLNPGANSMTYTEQDMVDTTLAYSHRDRKE